MASADGPTAGVSLSPPAVTFSSRTFHTVYTNILPETKLIFPFFPPHNSVPFT
uniref:Uncharacterized protein n=1 Tax=Anguilla anguilla TaxID=7936 RepID=A0A0E9R0A9_ANGAN